MSLIDDSIRNLEIAVAELKSALASENMTDPEEVANQRTLDFTNIRF